MNKDSKSILRGDFSVVTWTEGDDFITQRNPSKKEYKKVRNNLKERYYQDELADGMQLQGSHYIRPYGTAYVNRTNPELVEVPDYNRLTLREEQVRALTDIPEGPIRYDSDNYMKVKIPDPHYLGHYKLGGEYSKYRNVKLHTGEYDKDWNPEMVKLKNIGKWQSKWQDEDYSEVKRIALVSPQEKLIMRVTNELDPKISSIANPTARGEYEYLRNDMYSPHSSQKVYDFYNHLLDTQIALQNDPKFKDMSYSPSEVADITSKFGWDKEVPTRDVIQAIKDPVTKETLLRTAKYVREHGDQEMRDAYVTLVHNIAYSQDNPGDQSFLENRRADTHRINSYNDVDYGSRDWLFITDPELRDKYNPRKNNFANLKRKKQLALIKEANDVATGFKAQYKDSEGYNSDVSPIQYTTKWMYENNPRAYLDRYDYILPDEEVKKLQKRVRDSFEGVL